MGNFKVGDRVKLIGDSWYASNIGKSGVIGSIAAGGGVSGIDILIKLEDGSAARAYSPDHPLYGTDIRLDKDSILTEFYGD